MNYIETFKVTTPSDLEIVLTRMFDAPKKMVWRTLAEPALIRRWLLGPPGWEMTLCDNDFQEGGRFRWEWIGPDQAQLALFGEYKEITPFDRIVRTESFEIGCEPQAGQQLAAISFEESDGKTTLKMTLTYPSKEARDATIASGMDKGVSAGYARLDEVLAEIATEQIA